LKENSQIREIIFALDHDEKGQEATEKLIKKYQQRGFEVYLRRSSFHKLSNHLAYL
jgi:D-ribose pyranose/furanose isomerase RbsD